MSDRPIRVVLVDDDPLVRAGLTLMLGGAPQLEIVGEAGDGAEGLDVAARTRPDVVLMDIRMPRMDGLTATRHLLEQPSPPRVIVLTTFDADEEVVQALGNGATGFLLKDASPEQLLAAVRTVAAGEALLSPGVTRRLIREFVARPSRSATPDALDVLTEREREVVGLVALGLSNDEIAETLVISRKTVDRHRANVLEKLRMRDRVELTRYAIRRGLIEP